MANSWRVLFQKLAGQLVLMQSIICSRRNLLHPLLAFILSIGMDRDIIHPMEYYHTFESAHTVGEYIHGSVRWMFRFLLSISIATLHVAHSKVAQRALFVSGRVDATSQCYLVFQNHVTNHRSKYM